MLKQSLVLLFTLLAIYCEAEPLSCKASSDCPKGYCCRTPDGATLTSQQLPWLIPEFGEEVVGTCSQRLAQNGEQCDAFCGCDTDLTCYRPMSGACCPPTRCYDTQYVIQQQEYWANCKPPTCFFPPRIIEPIS